MRFKLSQQARWLLLFIVLSTLAIFLTGKSNSFVNWDDEQNFLRNAGLRLGLWDHLQWAWGTGLLGVFQPLAWNLLWIQTRFATGHADLFHVVSAVLHAAIAGGVFAFTLRLAARGGQTENPTLLLCTTLGALFFALHPLRVETVAWASCQPYLWSAGFGMLALWFYWNAADATGKAKRSATRYAAAFFLAGVLCKAVLFCFPAVLWIFHRRSLKQTLKTDWFYWAGAVGVLALAVAHRDISTDLRADQVGEGWAFWLTPFLVTFQFVSKTLLPVGLSPLYPLSAAGTGVGEAIVCVATLAGLIWTRNRGLWVFSGLVAALLVPGITAALTERIAFADRFAYLPALGLSIAAVPTLATRVASTSLVTVLGSAAVLALSTFTLDGIDIWKHSESLWRQAIAAGQTSGKTWANRGTALLEQHDLAQAEEAFRNALQQDSALPEAHNGLALCLVDRGDWAGARKELELALSNKPLYPEAISNLAFVFNNLGKPQEALAIVDRALVLDANNSRVHENRARILDRLGRFEDSILEYRAVVQADPRDAESHNLLGAQLMKAGRPAEAVESFSLATRLDPRQPRTRYNLALALQAAGKPDQAREALQGVLGSAPDFQPAQALMQELSTDSQARKTQIVQ